MRLKAERQAGVPLDIVSRIAGRGLDVDAHAVRAGMDGERQVMFRARLVDGIVLALTERRTRAGVGHYLDKMRMPGPAFDLARRRLWVLMRDRDGAFEYAVRVVLIEPGRGKPVVVGGSDGRAEVGIGMQVAESARQQHGVRDAELLDKLL